MPFALAFTACEKVTDTTLLDLACGPLKLRFDEKMSSNISVTQWHVSLLRESAGKWVPVGPLSGIGWGFGPETFSRLIAPDLAYHAIPFDHARAVVDYPRPDWTVFVDPETVTPPAWYKPDAGRARDLAMVFVTSGKHEQPRAMRITNRRWAFSALGAAAAATLTTRDTVYCCLPLHHPSGTLVAAHSALIGGSRLALASRFAPETFWDEVRRYRVSVVGFPSRATAQKVAQTLRRTYRFDAQVVAADP